MSCRLLLSMCTVSVRPSVTLYVCHTIQFGGWRVRRSFGTAFAKQLWPLFVFVMTTVNVANLFFIFCQTADVCGTSYMLRFALITINTGLVMCRELHKGVYFQYLTQLQSSTIIMSERFAVIFQLFSTKCAFTSFHKLQLQWISSCQCFVFHYFWLHYKQYSTKTVIFVHLHEVICYFSKFTWWCIFVI